MCIKFRFSISVVLILASYSMLKAQEVRDAYIGVKLVGTDINRSRNDLDATDHVVFDKWFSFELLAGKRLSRSLMLRSALGFTSARKDALYPDFDYQNTGMHVKAGLSVDNKTDRSAGLHPGLSLNYTSFVERGTYRIDGKYFGDLVGHPRRHVHALSLEPYADLRINISKRIGVLFTCKYDWILTRTKPASYPIIHIPGRGMSAMGLDLSVVYGF